MADTPIESPYATQPPNGEIVLYEGHGHVRDVLGHATQGDLRVTLEWFPTSGIAFLLRGSSPSMIDVGSGGTVSLSDGRVLNGVITSRHVSHGAAGVSDEIRGLGQMVWASEGIVRQVVFEVPNFPRFHGSALEVSEGGTTQSWTGRLRWETEAWIVVLDERRRATGEAETVVEQLRDEGGFALTHSGRLERKDGKPIAVDDLGDVLAGMSRFFSFVAGANTGVTLPRGLDDRGNDVWVQWTAPRVEPVRRMRMSCYPELVVDGAIARLPRLDAVAERFVDGWNEPNFRELLRYGVGWYLTANPHHSAETKITLSQSGLELAAWTHFVIGERISSTGFVGLPASDRLRLLLTEAGVSTGIPKQLGSLAAYAAETSDGKGVWSDGPEALTQIRNLLVHSTKKLRAMDIPTDVMVQTSQLAVWYLELALMFLLGYEDQFVSQVEGLVRVVPWAVGT